MRHLAINIQYVYSYYPIRTRILDFIHDEENKIKVKSVKIMK